MIKIKRITALLTAAAVSAAMMPAAPAVYAAGKAMNVRINEICSRNSKTIKDGSGKAPDYIELRNTSDKAVQIGGMGLSDSKDSPFAFTFPKGTSVPAGGYVIVFCDDSKESKVKDEYHAPFKLSSEGETVYLTAADRKSSEKVSFPAMGEDMVYGRVKDGDKFDILSPTPGKSNVSAKAVSYAAKPVFSKEGGFYDKEFSLTLSCDKGCEIYYTADGSDPRKSPTAVKYKDKIRIYNNTSDKNIASAQKNICLMDYDPPSHKVDKGIVIRAAAKNKKGVFSDVAAGSYFVGKTASYYKDMTVVSVITDSDNLFGNDKGIFAVGAMYDKWKKSSSYKELDPVNSENVTNYNQSGREWERPAEVQMFRNGKEIVNDCMGIRVVGNYSRSYAQKSLTFHARSEYGESKIKYELFGGIKDAAGKAIRSFDTVTVRNGGNECVYGETTRLRDTLVNELASGLAVSAAASEHAVVFINGEFWGYYALNEKIDESYIESHYGVKKNNVSMIKNRERSGSKKSTDDFISYYSKAMKLDMKKEENYKEFCSKIDLQSFMDYIAVETYICNSDWSNPDYVNNFLLWRADKIDKKNPYANGKWRFALFDTEQSSGIYYAEQTRSSYNSLGNMNREKTWGNMAMLFYKVMENAEFRKTFSANYRRIVNENFDYGRVNKALTRLSGEIKAASAATDRRFGYSNNFDRGVGIVRDFYKERPVYALRYLDELVKKYE